MYRRLVVVAAAFAMMICYTVLGGVFFYAGMTRDSAAECIVGICFLILVFPCSWLMFYQLLEISLRLIAWIKE